jgi:hypothetical protein
MAEPIEHGLLSKGPAVRIELGKRAVVIGAGIGGLSAAGALAQYFERVDILERDRLATSVASRSGTPQDRHPHGLLAGGLRSTKFFPVTSAISLPPAVSPSRSRATFNSSCPMPARCRSWISEYQCCAQRGR